MQGPTKKTNQQGRVRGISRGDQERTSGQRKWIGIYNVLPITKYFAYIILLGLHKNFNFREGMTGKRRKRSVHQQEPCFEGL